MSGRSDDEGAAAKLSSVGRWVANGGMLLAAGVFLYPFFWMFLGSFKSNQEIYDTGVFWPKAWTVEYYSILWSGQYFEFGGSLWNSFFISGLQAFGAAFFASLAGFAVSRCKGRAAFLAMGVALVVVPAQVMALPLFIWINNIGLFDTVWGVIAPGLASGLGFLFFARVYRLIPQELIDAGKVEGATEFRLYRTVFGLVRPFFVAFGFLQFVLAWHAHIVPLLILHSDAHRTLPLSLAAAASNSMNTPQAVIMAASVLGMLPLVLVFGLCYPQLKSALKEFVNG